VSSSAENVLVLERAGHVATLTLSQPARRNAFSLAMREALLAHLDTLMKPTDACRAIVLRGAGGTFCSGGDIAEMGKRTALEVRARIDLVVAIFRLMASGPKPIVCAVEGTAMGAGLSLAAASDYVVTTPEARFGCAFVRIGLLPDTGLFWSLAQKVGAGRARELMLEAAEIDGTRAHELGLANRLAAAGTVDAAALEVASRLARVPPLTMALLKSALAGGCGTLEDALATEVNLQPLLRRSQDHLEAIKAFMEKREPVFAGR
jgi:enoyl-CoA hydratase/carnithine racemase